MADFTMALTNTGRAMFADVQTGAVLVPTKIVMGSGQMPVGMTAAQMTEVVTTEATLAPLNKCLRSNDGKVTFGAVFSNEGSSAFAYRELALFCKAEYRNSAGQVTRTVPEALYIYGNAGASADQIPAGGSGTAVEKQIDIIAWIGNEAAVELSVSSGIYMTREQLDAALAQVSTQIADVGDLLSKHTRADNPHGISCQKISAVPTSRKVNGKPLSGDVTLSASDVEAAPANHEHNYAGSSTPGGNALAAVKLAVSRLFHVNLGSSAKARFDGSDDATIGVTGVLPIANGGTGASSASSAREKLGVAPAEHTHETTDIVNGFQYVDLPGTSVNIWEVADSYPQKLMLLHSGTNTFVIYGATGESVDDKTHHEKIADFYPLINGYMLCVCFKIGNETDGIKYIIDDVIEGKRYINEHPGRGKGSWSHSGTDYVKPNTIH